MTKYFFSSGLYDSDHQSKSVSFVFMPQEIWGFSERPFHWPPSYPQFQKTRVFQQVILKQEPQGQQMGLLWSDRFEKTGHASWNLVTWTLSFDGASSSSIYINPMAELQSEQAAGEQVSEPQALNDEPRHVSKCVIIKLFASPNDVSDSSGH